MLINKLLHACEFAYKAVRKKPHMLKVVLFVDYIDHNQIRDEYFEIGVTHHCLVLTCLAHFLSTPLLNRVGIGAVSWRYIIPYYQWYEGTPSRLVRVTSEGHFLESNFYHATWPIFVSLTLV